MNKVKVLLVDDEYLALDLLENFINKIPDLEIVGKCKSAIQALEVIHQQDVHLMFLDIQMPTLSGNNLLKTLKNPPLTIFTTAYTEYAIEAFNLNVVDYLLKPFSFERFLQAVNKAKSQLNVLPDQPPKPDNLTPQSSNDFYTAKADGKIIKLFHDDILYVEGLKEYVRFICKNGKYVVYESLKNLESKLPADQFIRVHKSYIVSLNKVTSLQGNQLEINKLKVPVSRGKREEIQKAIFGPME